MTSPILPLTGRAWEACVEVDREKLKKEKGYEYLLEYLRTKRGKEQVDLLGDALEKYFSSGESHRRDGKNMADFEMRHAALIRDIAKAMKEVGATERISTEIFGWFVINIQVHPPGPLRSSHGEVPGQDLPVGRRP